MDKEDERQIESMEQTKITLNLQIEVEANLAHKSYQGLDRYEAALSMCRGVKSKLERMLLNDQRHKFSISGFTYDMTMVVTLK